jgi:hypothetical protein
MLNIAGKNICYCCELQLIPKTVTAQMDVMLGLKFVEGAIPGEKKSNKKLTQRTLHVPVNTGHYYYFK